MSGDCCREHGDTVRKLARGALDVDAGSAAEALLRSCKQCREWWAAEFSGSRFDTVDRSVAAVVKDFVPPSRSRRHWWIAAAAAVILAFAGIAMWNPVVDREVPRIGSLGHGDVVTVLDFEDGEAVESSSTLPGNRVEQPQSSGDELSACDFESGDFSNWSSHG